MTQTTYSGWLDGQGRGRPSARRIARIAEFLKARSYLEIGVNRGATFNRLNFEYKVAVDPRFRFETRDFTNDGTICHETTSDVFFSTKNSAEIFDVMFLDGMHTFHQTFKDFVNSMACGHDRTVWLVDDVVPLDYYGSLPNQAQGMNLRLSETGNVSKNWTGDVYKLIFAIHDLFPSLRYVVITGEIPAQMLVWKEGRAAYEPILDSLEAIDRLNYADFLRLMPRLVQGSEDEAIEMLTASFTSRYPTEYPQPAEHENGMAG